MNDLVSTKWVKDELTKNEHEYVIIDVRFHLGNPKAGKEAYIIDHLPNAIYVDLDKDLSSAPSKHGGRHPLPDMHKLAEKLGAIGIGQQTKVIAYDDQGGAMASRFWWLLKHLGHSEVAVLDGGYSKWVKDGFETTSNIQVNTPKSFIIQSNKEWESVNASQVKEKINHADTILIDARESKRFLGLEEPIDPIAGHIPGALNIFWKNVLNKDGLWKDSEELKKTFSDVPQSKEVIVYCGSGVSACPNILALKKAGYTNVKLYAGSWSDWITHENYPVEKDVKGR